MTLYLIRIFDEQDKVALVGEGFEMTFRSARAARIYNTLRLGGVIQEDLRNSHNTYFADQILVDEKRK